MKIAHLISTFPPHVGGMGSVCYEEAKRLAGTNQVSVFTLKYSGTKYDDSGITFNIKRIKPVIKIGNGGVVRNFPKLLRGFDIVHLHYPFYGAIGSLIKAKKLLGFKLVVTYHMDPQGTGVKKCLQDFSDRLYTKKLFSIADKIIAVDADYLRNSRFGRFIGKEKIALLPNGVDTYDFKRADGGWSQAGQPELAHKKTILFVGNFLAVKNFELLIKLLGVLPQEVVLAAVGGGYEEERLRAIVRGTSYEGRIKFIGSTSSPEKLSEYYSAADIVAIPSWSESFSLVAIEAMACGAIVVASDIPGIRGRVTNGVNGYLAPVNDLDSWKNIIIKILDLPDEEKRIMRAKARERALQYDWSHHIYGLNEIYRSLI